MNIYLKNHLNSVYIIKFWYIRFCNRPPVFKRIATITLHEQINTIRHYRPVCFLHLHPSHRRYQPRFVLRGLTMALVIVMAK